jgi:hypothetical protein
MIIRLQPVLFALLAFAFVGCTKSAFRNDRPKQQGVPSPDGKSPNEGDALIPIEMRENLKLQAVRLKSESWWKNCVSVGVFIDGKQTTEGYISLGCNKDAASGKLIEVPVHREKCNVLKFKLETYKNLGDTCVKTTEPCNGPYSSTPTLIRMSERDADRKLFMIHNARTIESTLALDGFKSLISLTDPALSQNATGDTTLASWTRVFVEDQSQSNFERYIASSLSATERAKYGIDYDDFVFDIKAPAPVKVGFSGDNSFTGSKPSEFVTPAGCTAAH